MLRFVRYHIEKARLILKAIKMQIWLRSKGVRAGPILNKHFFKIQPPIGDPEKFLQEMLKHAKPTREFLVSEGGFEPLPVPQIAGQPWWPEGIARPKCKNGHNMNFIVQIFLSDVPLPDMPASALLSFHYCDECTMEGKMSWGWNDTENRGYDLSIFYDVGQRKPDSLGLVASSLTKTYRISFRDLEEVPNDEEDAHINHVDLPKDYPQGRCDFDENIYPGLKHIAKSKIGGWPTWAQYPQWPTNDVGEKFLFLGQLDWKLFEGTPWCLGGYAYLFITKDDNAKLKAELLIQTT